MVTFSTAISACYCCHFSMFSKAVKNNLCVTEVVGNPEHGILQQKVGLLVACRVRVYTAVRACVRACVHVYE